MKLKDLKLFILEVNALIDSGNYDQISIDEVHEHIDKKDVVPWIAKMRGDKSSLNLLYDENFFRDFNDGLGRMINAYGGDEKKWNVNKRGLCLLIAWSCELFDETLTIEIKQ